MNPTIILPIATGILLAFGQFFMKRLAVSLPTEPDIPQLLYSVIVSQYLYLFVSINIAASVTYVASLRYLTMTNTFALVFVTMGITVLALDFFVNRAAFSMANLIGIGLAIGAVLLISMR